MKSKQIIIEKASKSSIQFEALFIATVIVVRALIFHFDGEVRALGKSSVRNHISDMTITFNFRLEKDF